MQTFGKKLKPPIELIAALDRQNLTAAAKIKSAEWDKLTNETKKDKDEDDKKKTNKAAREAATTDEFLAVATSAFDTHVKDAEQLHAYITSKDTVVLPYDGGTGGAGLMHVTAVAGAAADKSSNVPFTVGTEGELDNLKRKDIELRKDTVLECLVPNPRYDAAASAVAGSIDVLPTPPRGCNMPFGMYIKKINKKGISFHDDDTIAELGKQRHVLQTVSFDPTTNTNSKLNSW